MIETSEPNFGENLIFCGGCPRSGTTLLQRILGSHSAVFSEQEFQYIPSHIIPMMEAVSEGISNHNVDRIIDHETLDDACRAFLNEVFQRKLKDTGKRVFCEKTPANALFIPQILKIFPKATFVLILRDPRDVANSFKGVRNRYLQKSVRPPRFVRTVATSVNEINRYLDISLAAQRENSRVLTIYYEDLVADPAREVSRICDHTGLNFEPNMLEIQKSTANIPAHKSELWYSKEALSAGINKSGVVTGGQLLSEREKNLVALFTNKHPELERYNLPKRAPSMFERLHREFNKLRQHSPFLPRKHP
ncbi:sulfotransferase family protein [Tritonibacter mobilis]|uniref:sulfotransferase family protein n=1 Tax=Tritonibacter mobilis TaxID=379347 RepID=UPI000F7F432F|nr:sulfotransferase [Tritonibacter mobilis]